MYACMVTLIQPALTVATVVGVTRGEKNARILWADTVDAMLASSHKGHATVDIGFGYTSIFNRQNEIVATVKVEAVKEY